MKPKHIKIFFIVLSLLVFILFFIKNLLRVIYFIKHPLDFAFAPVIYAALLFMGMVLHLGVYVIVMDEKQNVRKIEAEEGWEHAWDRE